MDEPITSSAAHPVVAEWPRVPPSGGAWHVLLELDGERVVAAEASLGYLHRGIEKLAERRRYHQVVTLLDRTDYVSAIHPEWAFALAVERLAGIEVPQRAEWLRTLVAELSRLASHLLWLGTFGLDLGATVLPPYVMRDREALLDVLEAICGSRMMFAYVRPGGVAGDLPTDVEPAIRRFLGRFPSRLHEYQRLLGGSEIFVSRVRDIGVVSRETAMAFGMTGACLRATGFGWDLRKERPYGAYPLLKFDIPYGETGDTWDRYMVRMEEMRQSLRITEQLLDGLPEGHRRARVRRVLRPPAGEVYTAVESPRGELGVHLVSDGSDRPYRMKLRPPSLYNLSVVDELLPGMSIGDVAAVVGSLDISPGEIDR